MKTAYSRHFNQTSRSQLFLPPCGKGSSWPSLSCCSPWSRKARARERHLLFKHSLILELSPWYGNTLQSPAFSKLGFLHWHPLPTFSLSRGSLLGLEVCPNLFILSAPETGSFVFTLHHRQCSPWCIYFKASLLRGLPAGKRFYLTQRYHKLIYLYLLKLWSRSIRKNAWKHSKECRKKLSATFSLQSPGYKVEGAFACLHICKRLCTPFTDFFFYYWSHEGLLATLST